jgi:YD repeat-containing protein
VTRRLDLAMDPGVVPRLDGRVVVDGPARFYRRRVLGEDVCGLWIGGDAVYDVDVYDPAGRPIGKIEPEGSAAERAYDQLRRALVAEAIQA